MVLRIPSSSFFRVIGINFFATGPAKPPAPPAASSAPDKAAKIPKKETPKKAVGAPNKVMEPGLSWPKSPSTPVGPGASKDGQYKNPEYYLYNEMSYFDIEAEMMRMRCPQPSNKK